MSKVKEEGMHPGENPLHEYMFFSAITEYAISFQLIILINYTHY
jgi:hypothetical protein